MSTATEDTDGCWVVGAATKGCVGIGGASVEVGGASVKVGDASTGVGGAFELVDEGSTSVGGVSVATGDCTDVGGAEDRWVESEEAG